MRANGLSDVLGNDTTAVCGWISCGDPYLAEVLGHSGYDAVVVDLQHGMFGRDRVPSLLAAVSSTPATPMVRVSANDAAEIGKVLDAGAYGVICPAIESAQEAARFVAACRYPPVGSRSFGPSRGLTYGGFDYATHANETILTWAMVETRPALDRVVSIVETEGLDGVYLGPNDLALSLGLPTPGETFSASLIDALEQARSACRIAGLWTGIFCSNQGQTQQAIDMGWDLITPGNDMGLIRAEASRRISWTRG